MPELSIVIVNWNSRRFILDCLRSIEAMTALRDREVIVVDNASTDGSPEEIAVSFPDVTLLRNCANLGFARGNNVGIRRSSGRYVCLMNSDVLLKLGCLDRLLHFMEGHSKVGLAGPRVLNADGTLQNSFWSFPSFGNTLARALALDTLFARLASRESNTTGEAPGRVEALSGCFMVARREALERVGLLDEDFFMYAEDVDWCRRFRHAGWELAYVPEAEAIHFGGSSSSKDPVRFFVENERANLRYWRKHHGALGQSWYAAVLVLQLILRIVPRTLAYVLRPASRGLNAEKIAMNLSCMRWLLGLDRSQEGKKAG